MTLRHDLDRLRVSLLAEASYCEQKAVLSVVHPEAEIESAEMRAGTAAHELLEAETEQIDADELARRLAAGEELSLREFPLAAKIAGVALRGQIDHLELQGRRARWVYDFKFSRYATRLFPNHRLQLALYGLLLAANDFDVADLLCAVVIVPPRRRGGGSLIETDPALANEAVAASQELRGAGGGSLLAPGFAVHAFAFDSRAARRMFRDAVGYWIGRREARPADTPAKCRSCPYNAQGLCSVALAPPEDRLQRGQ